MTRFGGYADTVVVAEGQVFGKPASLSHEQAATLPVNYLTAWQLLVVMGALSPDETVLIHNAGGGVGLAAIDVAVHIGARIDDQFDTATVGEPADFPSGDGAAAAFRLGLRRSRSQRGRRSLLLAVGQMQCCIHVQ